MPRQVACPNGHETFNSTIPPPVPEIRNRLHRDQPCSPLTLTPDPSMPHQVACPNGHGTFNSTILADPIGFEGIVCPECFARKVRPPTSIPNPLAMKFTTRIL
jgi:hypothetical protein